MQNNDFKSLVDSAADVLLEAAYNELETRTYTIEATKEVLNRFEKFLSHVQWCSCVGHSTAVAFPIDGDGPDRFKVTDPENLRDKHPGEKEIKSYDSGKFEMA